MAADSEATLDILSKEDLDKLLKTNPEQWLAESAHGPDLYCIVVFRGSWCRYDRHYLQKLGNFHKKLREMDDVEHPGSKIDVTLVAWTSEGIDGAKKADEEWKLTEEFGYDDVFGDETNALVEYLKEDEILPDLVIATPEDAHVADVITPGTYPNGIAMPGMVYFAHHGNIVFSWSADFQEPGWGGPGRPDPEAMWATILKRKHALDHGKEVMISHGANMKLCTTDEEIAAASV